jgi:hypothetical protein
LLQSLMPLTREKEMVTISNRVLLLFVMSLVIKR